MQKLRNASEMFVDYKQPLKVINTIFLCWGLMSVVNGLLLNEFGMAIGLEKSQISLFAYMFFGTYFIFGIPAAYIVNKFGFKQSIEYGLITSASAVFFMVAGARMQSVPIILLGIFVQVVGFTILQVACNPYIIFTGHPKQGATRLSFAGAHNSIGSWIAPLIGILISNITIPENISTDIQAIITYKTEFIVLPYVLITVVFAGLAVLVHFSDLPDFNDFHDIEPDAEGSEKRTSILQYKHIWFAFFAIFAYVGAEVGIMSSLGSYLQGHLSGTPLEDSITFIAPYFLGAMIIGRFIGGHMLRTSSPVRVLKLFSLFAFLLTIVSILLDTHEGMFSILALGFFNGVMWPIIFTLAVQGMGRLVPYISGFLIMGIVGGALIKYLMNIWVINPETGFMTISQFLYIPAGLYLVLLAYSFWGHEYKKKTA